MTSRGLQDNLMDEPLSSNRFGRPPVYLATFPRMYPSIVPATTAGYSSNFFMGHDRKVKFINSKIIQEESCQCQVISEEEMQKQWWTLEDLDKTKRSAKELGSRLLKLSKVRGCFVETAHKKTSLYLTKNLTELVKMSASSPNQDLLHWCARSDGRRGLERVASRTYSNRRKEDVYKTKWAVLQEQDRQRKLHIFEPEELAKISRASSRRARTFSLFMGEADAQAAVRGVDPKSSKQQVQVSKKPRLHGSNTAPSMIPVDANTLTASSA